MGDVSKLKLRRATPDDLPVLLRYEQCVVEEERPYNSAIRESGVTYYDLHELLSSPEACLQVAEADGQVIGCGYARLEDSKATFVHERHAYLGFMYVAPSFRGLGINRMIIESLFDWGAELGIVYYYLEVYAGNEPAIRAYEKAGFEHNLIEMKLQRRES